MTTTALASTLACGGREVEVISSTTAPSSVAASSPSAPSAPSAPATVLVRGTIDAIDATAGAVTVHGTIVSVPATAAIRARTGTLTFADLKVGETVAITATRSGSALIASEVVVEADGNPPAQQVEIDGSISALQGSCPVVTFSIRSTAISTTTTTTFDGRTCAQLANGDPVTVDGSRQGSGAIVATRVSSRPDGSR
jgi:Cu/Ag efflux protein CusF